MEITDAKAPQEMTPRQLQDWLGWALNEISEYEDFIKVLKKEIKIRNSVK